MLVNGVDYLQPLLVQGFALREHKLVQVLFLFLPHIRLATCLATITERMPAGSATRILRYWCASGCRLIKRIPESTNASTNSIPYVTNDSNLSIVIPCCERSSYNRGYQLSAK